MQVDKFALLAASSWIHKVFYIPSLVLAWAGGLCLQRSLPTSQPSQFFEAYAIILSSAAKLWDLLILVKHHPKKLIQTYYLTKSEIGLQTFSQPEE